MTRLRSLGTNRMGLLGQTSLVTQHNGHHTTPKLEPEPPGQYWHQGHQGIMVCLLFDFMRDPFALFMVVRLFSWLRARVTGRIFLRKDHGYNFSHLLTYLSLTILGTTNTPFVLEHV